MLLYCGLFLFFFFILQSLSKLNTIIHVAVSHKVKWLTLVKNSVIVSGNLDQSQFLFSDVGHSIFTPVEERPGVKTP